jgi:hypothetical protein
LSDFGEVHRSKLANNAVEHVMSYVKISAGKAILFLWA